jgi:hypothetical protein
MKKLIFALALSCCTTAYAADAVPFKAVIHTDIEFTNSCGPAWISLFITGTGQGSHFGRMVIAGPSQIVFDATGVGAQTGTSTHDGHFVRGHVFSRFHTGGCDV